NVHLDGNIGLFENNVTAAASFGPLAVTADASGTLDAPTGKFFGADVSLALVNPVDATSRITVNEIISAITDKKFFFQAGQEGGTPTHPNTGFIDGVVAGGLGLTLSLEPGGPLHGLPVNFGAVSIDAQSPNWLISPPSLSNPFGFPSTDTSLAAPGASVSRTGLVSGSGVLSKDMVFVLSQTIGGQTFATPVIVRGSDTADNHTAADLEADIQSAVDLAIARIQRLADQAAVTPPRTAATVDVTLSGSTVTFPTPAANNASSVTLRDLFVNIDFTKPSGFDELLNSLKNLSFDDIVAVLRIVVGMLQQLDGTSSGTPLADVFNFKLPVIDRSVGDLVNLSGDFLNFVDDLASNPAGSLQKVEAKLRDLLGLPPLVDPDDSILSFDTTNKILYFNL